MSIDQPPTLFVGIDWATQENQLCVLDAEGAVVGERSLDNDGAGLGEMCAWLLGFEADARRIAVAIEVPHGPVVETLLERGFVVHSINPKQLDRFRDRFTLAGAKDDRLDARVLGSSLRTDGHAFRRLQMAEPTVIELREWSRMADDLKEERLTNRVRQQLRRYYPQLLDVGPDPGANWFLDLWKLMPTPAKARRTQRRSIERILRKHRIRRIDAAEVRELVRQPPVTVAPGTTEAARIHIEHVATRLRLVNEQLKHAHRQLDRLTDELCADHDDGTESPPGKRSEQHDAAILRSLPGVGRIVLAVLLAEASQAIAARDYQALRALCGVAPVTRRSGKRKVVVMRQACHPRLRDAVYHWSRVATQNDEVARRSYASLRARGHSHGRALRSVADRLLRIACAMLRDGTAYDPAKRARAA
ncbi:MAG: IS110 family transposase [Sandaracinaceae bacterium]